MKRSLTNLRKMTVLFCTVGLMLAVISSCKKKEDDPAPIPPVPTPPETPAVFKDKQLHLMSDYEVRMNLSFPGHTIHRLGKGLNGGEDPIIPDALKEIGKTLSEFHDYEHTEMEFDKVNEALGEISNQIATLQAEIDDLANEMGKVFVGLESFYTTGLINTYFVNINGITSSDNHNGFNYYGSEGAKYQSHVIGQTEMNKDTAYLRQFCQSVFNNEATFDVCNWSEQLNGLICPAIGGSNSNALKTYANAILEKVDSTSVNLNDSVHMMKLYLFLESYFLQVVNKQFQCVNVWSNVCNYYDTTGYQSKLYFTGTFRSNITGEVNEFLSTVDYLVANLGEYRNAARFTSDMLYANAGMAPDEVFLHVNARAQFVANLLYDALGLPYPVMCGHILTPRNYTNGNSPIVEEISVYITGGSAATTLTSTANHIYSQLPYTYWTAGDPAVCQPDNIWHSYRFGKLGSPDQAWNTSQCLVQVYDNNSSEWPWTHYTQIKGTCTPLYYNPQDPSKTSTVPSPSCTILFGYFSAAWPWGFLWMTHSQWHYKKIENFNIKNFNGNMACGGLPSPFAGTSTNPDASPNVGFNMQNPLIYQYPYNTASTMIMGGNTANTNWYYMASDHFYTNVNTGNAPPNNGSIQIWGTYRVFYGMKGNGGDDIWVSLGSGIDSRYCSKDYPTTQNIQSNVVNSHYKGQSSNWNSGFGNSANLILNHGYQPGVQYYYQTFGIGTVPANIQLITGMQMVYGGHYPLQIE